MENHLQSHSKLIGDQTSLFPARAIGTQYALQLTAFLQTVGLSLDHSQLGNPIALWELS